jgi:twitching motility protein PilT
MIEKFQQMVEAALQKGAHDLHLKTAFAPNIRVASSIEKMDFPPLTPREMDYLANMMLDKNQRNVLHQKGQVDCSYELENICRLRTNIFMQRNSLAISMRLIEPTPPEFMTLGFPETTIERIKEINQGMILITGATNAGKSTTMASIVDYLARHRSKHIITIEDPVEYIFSSYDSTIISQRQVGSDVINFSSGLKSALRQDPDIIMIGELRDQETVETALKAAETGHLVLGTLHTSNAVQSILRLINIFPSHQRDSVRYMLSSSLKLIISQMLLPTRDHKKRILAAEVLPMMSSVANLIRQKKVHEVSAIMRVGRRQGCVLMQESVKVLLQKGLISAHVIPENLLSEK